jgi:uncharacterized protein YndB with AHSA1/START domain
VESVVRIERVVDLPRVIVWDALIDPVLVEGWLHPSLRLVGGEPAVELRQRVDPAPETDAVLHVRAEQLGEVRLALVERAGGTRGSSTVVTVEVLAPDPRFAAALRNSWQTRLDQLENLLRGHPVVWQSEQAAPARTLRAN